MLTVYFNAFLLVVVLMTALWLVSVLIKNVSIVDLFWGMGFILVNTYYFISSGEFYLRKTVVFVFVLIWGLRLSIYLASRNIGKGEDFRYQEFRRKYGKENYWWISYFQVFLLQGLLIILVSLPLFAVNYYTSSNELNWLDYFGIILWLIGFIFESVGDYQLTTFKKNPSNKNKVLDTGLWKYTRHPNYFGDAAVWWAFAFFSLATESFWFVSGSLLMTFLIIKVSGVALLEKSLNNQKPKYQEYIKRTSSFFPWFPKSKL